MVEVDPLDMLALMTAWLPLSVDDPHPKLTQPRREHFMISVLGEDTEVTHPSLSERDRVALKIEVIELRFTTRYHGRAPINARGVDSESIRLDKSMDLWAHRLKREGVERELLLWPLALSERERSFEVTLDMITDPRELSPLTFDEVRDIDEERCAGGDLRHRSNPSR